ncbi:hypothetical protein JCM19237_3876 [Photobacterium aphoticum]|uniref:Uncharacterized protein n=1 Tax=Photobacterium aphoticum TaxID=754436 RepID=A0A090QUD3_9GAMM|nr:hypothetical protein JCM19237_3876 [Photobacterium aphoticum]
MRALFLGGDYILEKCQFPENNATISKQGVQLNEKTTQSMC